MEEFVYVIQDLLGVHARPANKLIELSKKFDVSVKVKKGDKEANMLNLDDFLSLGIKYGDEIKVLVDGKDKKIFAKALEEAFHEYL